MKPLLVVLFLFTGCTTVGFHDTALRQRLNERHVPPMTVRLCAYLDDGISEQEAQALLDAAWNPDEEQVGVAWKIATSESLPRPAYWYWGIRSAVNAITVPPGCDRAMWFIGRHVGDVVYGLVGLASPIPLPEALGYVDDEDRTRGYVVASRATLPQVVFITPASALRHELYHMLGCEHSLSLEGCYDTIAELRRKAGWVGYVPGWDPGKRRAVRLPGR